MKYFAKYLHIFIILLPNTDSPTVVDDVPVLCIILKTSYLVGLLTRK